jgi:hypothetical protein
VWTDCVDWLRNRKPEELEIFCRDLCEVTLFWSEVSYGEVLGDKSALYIRVTLYWGYLIVL